MTIKRNIVIIINHQSNSVAVVGKNFHTRISNKFTGKFQVKPDQHTANFL
jgi:hypothetical protein